MRSGKDARNVSAEEIEKAHFETSHIQHNDENALSYTISLALYAARNYYTLYRESPGGKGFTDMVFIPKKNHMEKPALVVELKWDQNAETALKQIKQKRYCDSLKEYQGCMLLVGVNYDKKTKNIDVKLKNMKNRNNYGDRQVRRPPFPCLSSDRNPLQRLGFPKNVFY